MQQTQLCYRFWVEVNDRPFMGNGRARLLEEIMKTGSISAAAKNLRMSYRQAWEHIRNMNELSGSILVITATGGKNGGGAFLSEHGIKLLARFRDLEKKMVSATADMNF